MVNAKEALECAKAIMTVQSKAKMLDYVGEWNELMLYLEARARVEAQQAVV